MYLVFSVTFRTKTFIKIALTRIKDLGYDGLGSVICLDKWDIQMSSRTLYWLQITLYSKTLIGLLWLILDVIIALILDF